MTVTVKNIIPRKQVEAVQTGQYTAVNVQWANQILRDGEVISETFERKAYMQEQAAEFATEVEGAAGYTAVLGW